MYLLLNYYRRNEFKRGIKNLHHLINEHIHIFTKACHSIIYRISVLYLVHAVVLHLILKQLYTYYDNILPKKEEI